ncbi:uncharacterized protein LOC107483307 [Arachis duranensis]|uniref:Uncharacterized protein LOC107483307 n=1 Tax=Arachis duranensis TaxID=130453 RepID=A0A6P4CZ99_ARADU|nr:uncharacterized protein LOC107483307 [Arachis duranensis]
MKMLMWNCRGLGKTLTVHNIQGINRSHSPEVMFLCETKNNSSFVTRQCERLGFPNSFCVNPIGVAGGLVLAWRTEVQINVMESASFFIHFKVLDTSRNKFWNVIAVHLHSEENQRSGQFDRLLQILNLGEELFLVLGDFNAIIAHQEKEGGRPKATSSVEKFQNFLDGGNLSDLGYEGIKYTWNNRQFGDSFIRERLDRCLVSNHWRQDYPTTKILHLEDQGSDHRPILLESELQGRRPK